MEKNHNIFHPFTTDEEPGGRTRELPIGWTKQNKDRKKGEHKTKKETINTKNYKGKNKTI